MAVAIILLLVAVASVLFHLFSPWWWTPIASNWRYIDDTITLTFWITGAVFFAIVAFMAYCVFRFQSQGGKAGSLRSRKQEARMVAQRRDCNRRRSHVGAGFGCLAPVRHGSGRCDRGRGHGTAMAVELSASRKGRPAWDFRCPQCQFRQSYGVESRRSRRTRRHRHSKTTICTCRLGNR